MGATLAIIGTGLQAYSQYQEGQSTAEAYEAQAKAAQQNANIISKQREQTAQNYAHQQTQLRERHKLAAGAARAQAGAAGLAGGVGSSGDLLQSSQGAFEQDTNRLLQNQRNDTWSQYVNQVNYENQANTYSTMASNAKSSGIINALGTLAAGSASFFGSGSSASDTSNYLGLTTGTGGTYDSITGNTLGNSYIQTFGNTYNTLLTGERRYKKGNKYYWSESLAPFSLY